MLSRSTTNWFPPLGSQRLQPGVHVAYTRPALGDTRISHLAPLESEEDRLRLTDTCATVAL
ncbi:hypothetical protein BDN67DRAFT_969305 [Paxillus ammoniavirescens]|nr:hypothetical protein BDN67DRAFT_969305 [Paxillus ammoniavirescens]